MAYCYLDLHDHPVWIRPQGSSINSFATFSIQSIVTGAAYVTAVINPNALARIVDLESVLHAGDKPIAGILHRGGQLVDDSPLGEVPAVQLSRSWAASWPKRVV